MAEPFDSIEEHLEAEEHNADRLVAALKVARLYLDDDTLHCVVGPPDCQLTVGHVVDGALAQHEQMTKRRPQ